MQKFALKLISRHWDLGYEELLSITNVPKLGEWRLHLKLAQVFMFVHGLCYFPKDVFVTQPSHSSRLARSDTLLCSLARTSYYFHSFVPSLIRAWNPLIKQKIRSPCKLSGHSNVIIQCIIINLCICSSLSSIFLYCFWVHT